MGSFLSRKKKTGDISPQSLTRRYYSNIMMIEITDLDSSFAKDRLLENPFYVKGNLRWIFIRRDTLGIWIGWISTVLKLDNRRHWPSSFSNSGRRLLLSGRDCPYYVGHNDFQVQGEGSPVFL